MENKQSKRRAKRSRKVIDNKSGTQQRCVKNLVGEKLPAGLGEVTYKIVGLRIFI